MRDNSPGALVALVCLMVFATAFVFYTSGYLPENVATHFGAGNQADGWMSRNGYLAFMLGSMIGVAALVSFIVGTLPAKYPQWTNLPNRDYWLAPQRRDESLNYLNAHGKRLGGLIVMMMLGMHYVVLKANHLQPPALPVAEFSAVLFGFALALVWWLVRLFRRFGKSG